MGAFVTTRWSLILATRAGSNSAHAALEELCCAYRAPVLAYIRHRGHARDEAEDLTQSFFAHFLARRLHVGADPVRGQFRAYLLTAIRNFLATRRTRERTGKRRGDTSSLSLDALDAPNLAIATEDTPEQAFERSWALTILDRASRRLEQEARTAGKHALYQRLHEFLIEPPAIADYHTVAQELGIRRNTLAVAIHRMRHRLQELVRDELADTVADASGIGAELIALRQVLGSRVASK